MDREIGSWRSTDPSTSEEAARVVDATGIKHAILDELRRATTPLNGWELSVLLKMPTISVVPRLCPMRTAGWIVQAGERPGPTGRAQIAYMIAPPGNASGPVEYARKLWPLGFTKLEIEAALHHPVSIQEMIRLRAIENTHVRREKHVVWRLKPHQLALPFEGGSP